MKTDYNFENPMLSTQQKLTIY